MPLSLENCFLFSSALELDINKINMKNLIIDAANKRKKQIGVYPIDDSLWTDVGQWSEYHKAIDRFA